MQVGSMVGEEEEVGNAKSVREHGHGKRVIEMRWLNDGKAHAYIGRHGTAPDAVAAIVRGDRQIGLGLIHLLEHASFSRSCLPFGIGPALEYPSMAGGGRRGRQ